MKITFFLVLAAAGEWLRRDEPGASLAGGPSAHIPSVLIAAATITALGTLYAAHALYGFIGATLAFLAPLPVSSDAPDPWPVVLFIAVVSTAAQVPGVQ